LKWTLIAHPELSQDGNTTYRGHNNQQALTIRELLRAACHLRKIKASSIRLANKRDLPGGSGPLGLEEKRGYVR
jgi:hypothetical protein